MKPEDTFVVAKQSMAGAVKDFTPESFIALQIAEDLEHQLSLIGFSTNAGFRLDGSFGQYLPMTSSADVESQSPRSKSWNSL